MSAKVPQGQVASVTQLFAFLFSVALLGVTATPSLSVAGADESLDLHGNPCDAQLVLFVAGNQWMAMPALIGAFERTHRDVKRVFYETLPPGILTSQLRSGSLLLGDLRIAAPPDVLMIGESRMNDLEAHGLVETPRLYATNILAIAVRKGNPKHIESLRDLGLPGVRVAMPNPEYEGIARQIEQAYLKSGGQKLLNSIMVRKLRAGTTLLTQIHHRQTPEWLSVGRVDAGPVWITEALYQQRIGAPVETIRLGAAGNVRATYEAAAVSAAPHPGSARDFVRFLTTVQAQEILHAYGFSVAAHKEGSP
jgi:ABC-type molybdate transport system substrate-binding protein